LICRHLLERLNPLPAKEEVRRAALHTRAGIAVVDGDEPVGLVKRKRLE